MVAAGPHDTDSKTSSACRPVIATISGQTPSRMARFRGFLHRHRLVVQHRNVIERSVFEIAKLRLRLEMQPA